MFSLWGERILILHSLSSDIHLRMNNVMSIMLAQKLNIQTCLSFRRPVEVQMASKIRTK